MFGVHMRCPWQRRPQRPAMDCPRPLLPAGARRGGQCGGAECLERHSRRQVPPHWPARRGFVRGIGLSGGDAAGTGGECVSLSGGDTAWTGRRMRQFVGRRRCLDGAANASVHRGAEERRHGRDTRTADISAAQLASRVPQWSFMAADYQIDVSKPLVSDLDSSKSRPVPSVIGSGGSPAFSA
jgi:hypothetical protein